jgi:two-component system, OmpR family, alkaline phosphatase synthesis response regulator PhoP
MPKKILAVDDERHIVRLVEVNLQRAGYEVVTAYDGREALEKVKSENPDLVVLDVMMPYMDGFEVLKNLKADPATAEIPVIMLTAKAQDADVFRGWQSGVDCYLTKPFSRLTRREEQGADEEVGFRPRRGGSGGCSDRGHPGDAPGAGRADERRSRHDRRLLRANQPHRGGAPSPEAGARGLIKTVK